MENVRSSSRPALWLMLGIMFIALNLRPSMAAVGPLLTAIRGDIPLSFTLASLLTMLPVMAMGLAMFVGLGVSQRLGEQRTVVLSLLIIGLATVSRLFVDSAAELILSAVLAGIGIALIQALMPVLIKSRFSDNAALCMGLYVTSIMGGAALAASFAPWLMTRTGSWRLGLAGWALLTVPALLFWCAQRAGMPTQPARSSSNRSFFRNPRAWLLAIFLAWARLPTPVSWPGWRRTT
jgi:CP family cyanate transporter-like MFS transporter